MGWVCTSDPDPVYAVTTRGSTTNRSKGHRPACPSSSTWVSNVVTDVPCGRTSFVRAILGETRTVISRARSAPPESRKLAPGATETSTSTRDVLGRTSMSETMTSTSSASGVTSVHPASLSSLAA
ncbi:hypothetical protein A5N75_01555 [Prescottella equi]|nr:hypothetical protein A6F56_06320 [Prescottella equi]ORL08688.1 hypothetical protein A6I84_08200 [Prescottella equi]ORL79528.1 hypothetical protein A5N75_01555 [Prescottella equi]ORL94210.1 hypothetical protein A5N76_01555 [Prescottella equi]